MDKEGVSCIIQTTVKKKGGYTHERQNTCRVKVSRFMERIHAKFL